MSSENRSRAVIVLDMVNDLSHREGRDFVPSTSEIIPFIQGELQYFRERMRPVIFCNTVASHHHETKEADHQSNVIQALSPRVGEIIVKKTRPNAFFGTDLLAILTDANLRELTIVGVCSHTAVLSTAIAALDHGFFVVVPETCVWAPDSQDHAAALRIISRWLS